MSPFLKRYLITVGLVSVVVAVGILLTRGPQTTTDTPVATVGQTAPTEPASTVTPAVEQAAPTATSTEPTVEAPTKASYIARLPAGTVAPQVAAQMGSLDPKVAPFQITFSKYAAGIERIVSADFWLTVSDRHQAAAARAANDPAAMPKDSQRHVFAGTSDFGGFTVPVLAARVLELNGVNVNIYESVWAETAPGAFVTEIADATGAAVARVERTFATSASSYDIVLSQRVTNLTSEPIKVRMVQYGPGDPPRDNIAITEVRRFHFGYLYPATRDPSQTFVSANGQLRERSEIVSKVAANDPVIWPNTESREGQYTLSWFGTTDRYFALAVHAPYAPPAVSSRALTSVTEVRALGSGSGSSEVLFTTLWSPTVEIAPATAGNFDLNLYAGPLDSKVLDGVEPYIALNMGDLIVYLMAGCCSFCTFSWLADGLLWFLSFLHDYVVFDWGFAIIALVIVVRTILHPVQKKSQISMQRFSRAMQAMKPELDSLQKKFKDDPSRMQQEQMRMFRERGVSPAGCIGGMLPTFAQMPIWMALYATLFFAFELRQEAAFFGVFQQFGDWSFLADLSAPDRFYAFSTPINLVIFEVSALNLLPILMGIVFWFQQKYMAPPMTATMSDDQIAQQKMMKWMMVIMFPVMTYAAPSGLTLYILTSTCIGIVEGRIIKKQVDAMDLTKKPNPNAKPGLLSRLYAQALERAKEKEAGAAVVKKKYKDR